MAPQQAAHGDGHGGAGIGTPLDGHGQVGHVAPGAADKDGVLGLGVQADEPLGGEGGCVQAQGAQHADLLVHGEDHLQPGVGQVVAGQEGQGHGHGDAVVAPQGGALGVDVLLGAGQVQALLGHVLGAARSQVTDHVHVALEDHRGDLLIAGGGLLDDDDIVHGVLVVFQVMGKGEIGQVLADGLGVPRAVGDGGDLLKIGKDLLGFQMFQYCHSGDPFLRYGLRR